ncbi:hypothetical protein HDU85_000859 [Gaertneriomyces sp. JEL0708]|nr:hypothetical protein HDU85_000859 [Gaertneriomyces sp. JEL0708]
MAQAIMKLQSMFGIAPRIVGKGTNAKLLSDLLMRLRQELLANTPDSGAAERVFPVYSDIDSLIIIDRSVDLVTPMCTQLTYEGLIDEFFGIRSTFVEVDPSFIAGPSPAGTASGSTAAVHNKPKKVALNNSDKLHAHLRDLNFAVVGSSLSQAARRIHDNYEGRHQAKTVSQLKNFIGKLSDLQAEHQSLRLHTGIAEELTKATNDKDFNSALEAQQNFVAGIVSKSHLEYIEHLIDKQGPMTQAVRLLCLYSLVEGGMKPKAYDSFRRDIVQAYGHKHVLTLQNLAEVGLFRKQTSRASSYSSIRKVLRLIVDDVNEHDPNDASYVYSGYAPISIRLVQVACHGDVLMPISASGGAGILQQVTWKGWEEHLKLLPGPTFEDQQTAADRRKGTRNRPKTTLVVFLGGCTFTEVAALRFLTRREEGGREFIVVTTNMINGSTLLDSVAERVRQSAAS